MEYIPRLSEKEIEKSLGNNKILILLGARQVGKTTLLNRIIHKFGGKLFNLDIEVDKNRLYLAKSLTPPEAIKSLGDPNILVIDEAQRLPEISRIVKGWFDAGIKNKIILSGSSSLNLLDQSAEALTGRNEKLFLTALTFWEIIYYQPWFSRDKKSLNRAIESFKSQINSLLISCIIFGSYPETIITANKEQYLLNLTSDYLLKDIFQFGLIKKPEFIKQLLLLLAHQIGSEASTLELANNLQVSRQTIERYLDLLESTFVIFRLPAFSTNLRKEIVKNKKIYFWDTGIRNALLKEFSLSNYRSDIGQVWENWIVAEYAKKNLIDGNLKNLYFWRSRDGAEVDLIIKSGNKLLPIEIKWKSKKSFGSNAFFTRYKVKPLILTSDNFIKFLK